jgi:ankyrin repeat protein
VGWQTGLTPLMACAVGGLEQPVAALLGGSLRADVNAQDALGMSALIAASLKGHVGVVRLLLKAGANPNLARKVSAALIA